MRSGSTSTIAAGPKGVAHVHSTISFDGQCDYARLRDLFVSRGLRFACITEHIETLDQAAIDRIVAGCAAHSDAEFLFLPGVEMDFFGVYFAGIRGGPVDFGSRDAVYRSLAAMARMLVLAHPIKKNYAYPPPILDACDAVEVLNSKHDGRFYFRRGSERLLARIRERRPGVAAVVGLDFHQPSDLCPIHMELLDPVPLDPDSVCGALRAGRVRFLSGAESLGDLGSWARATRRFRTSLMDVSHGANRLLRRLGIRVPKGIRRRIARVMEGP